MKFKAENDTDVTIRFESEDGVCPYLLISKESSKFFDRKSKHFADYVSIFTDLENAHRLLEIYETNKDDIIKESLWKQAVILLGRTFTKGDERNVNLQVQNFKTYSEKFIQTLEELISLRHSYIAHQGKNDKESFDALLVLNPEDKKGILSLECSRMQTIALAEIEITDFKYVIISLIDWTQKKIEQLKKQILDRFTEMNIAELYSESVK